MKVFGFYSLLVEQQETRNEIREETKKVGLTFEDSVVTSNLKVICFIKGDETKLMDYFNEHKKDYRYVDTKKGKVICLVRGL